MVNKDQQEQAPFPDSGCFTFEQLNVMTNSNKLWMEYAFWVRALLNAVISEPEKEPYIADKLFNGVIPEYFILFEFYYGTQLAETFRSLFTNFAAGAWGLVRALESSNEEAINVQTTQLYQIVDELADFLAQLNTYYSAEEWKEFFYRAIELIIDETLALIQKNFQREVEISDSMANLAMQMGSYMANGIISAI